MSTKKPMSAGQLALTWDRPATPKPAGKRRARAGGELGANREFYRGGQFVNTVPENPKGTARSRPATARREEFAPFRYAEAPAPGLRAIYAQLAGIYAYDRGRDRFGDPPEAWRGYVGAEHAATLDALRERYNRGERWA